jgi:ribosomal protein S18 acetylase RimI-like enzyme
VSIALGISVAPAASLDADRLAALFTAAYAGYWFPIELDAAGLERIVRTSDLDLDASRVAAAAGDPVGVAMLGVRGDAGWIGGMGVLPDLRRRGIGELLLGEVLDAARGLGLQRVTLEVLEQNEGARRLYDRIGFSPTRLLDIWTLPGGQAGDAGRARAVDVDEALRRIRAARAAPEPWQRADETLAHLRNLDSATKALVTDDGAAVYRVTDGQASVVQLAAATTRTARDLIATVAAGATRVTFLNVPSDDPAVAAFEELGGTLASRQIELAFEL